MNWNGYIFFHLQQPEVVEFPNPLLENPIKEESGDIIIPGNRALINLNLSRKFFYSYAIKENSDRKWFAMLKISSMFFLGHLLLIYLYSTFQGINAVKSEWRLFLFLYKDKQK